MREELMKLAVHNKLALDALARQAIKRIVAKQGGSYQRAAQEIRTAREKYRAVLEKGDVSPVPGLHGEERGMLARSGLLGGGSVYNRDSVLVAPKQPLVVALRRKRQMLGGEATTEDMRSVISNRAKNDVAARNSYESLTGQHASKHPIEPLAKYEPWSKRPDKSPFMYRGLTTGLASSDKNTFVTRNPGIAMEYAIPNKNKPGYLAAYRKNQFSSRAGEAPHGVGHREFLVQGDTAARARLAAARRAEDVNIPYYEDIVSFKKGQSRPAALYQVGAIRTGQRSTKGEYLPPLVEQGIRTLRGPAFSDVVRTY